MVSSQNNQKVPELAEGDLDVRELVAQLSRKKPLIIASICVGALIGLVVSVLSTRYVNEGLFLTPSMQIADYKRYEPLLTSKQLLNYLSIKGLEETTQGTALKKLAGELDSKKMLKPEFTFTDRDKKAFGVQASGDQEVLGIRMRIEQKTPGDGQVIGLLSEFVRDAIIKVDLQTGLLNSCEANQNQEQLLRSQQVKNEFKIAQEKIRLQNLKDIVAKNPDSGTVDARQIVSLERGNERYLSPTAQMIATEILIDDLKLEESALVRAQLASTIKKTYYCQAYDRFTKVVEPQLFLNELEEIKAALLADYDNQDGVVEEVKNELDVQRQSWLTKYLVSFRFVAPIENNEFKKRSPTLALGVLLGALLGALLGCIGALVHGWWKRESTVIQSY